MANTIKIKRSSIQGVVPTALQDGELAINQADNLLFYKDSLDVIKSFSLVSSSGGENLIAETAILNFGKENNTSFLTIVNDSLTNLNVKSISFLPIETNETSLDDFILNGVNFTIANIIDNFSFDIIGTSINNASGNYTVKYLIQF